MHIFRHIARARGGDTDDVTRAAVLLDMNAAMVGHRLIPRQAVSYVSSYDERRASWILFPAVLAALHATLALTAVASMAFSGNGQDFYWNALWTAPDARVVIKNYVAFSCAMMVAYTIISFFDVTGSRNSGEKSDFYFVLIAKIFVLLIGLLGLFVASVLRLQSGAFTLDLATPYSRFGVTEMGLAVLIAAGPSFALRRVARGSSGWTFCTIVTHGGASTRIASKNAEFMTETTRVFAQWAAGALERPVLVDLVNSSIQGKGGASADQDAGPNVERAARLDAGPALGEDNDRAPFSEPALATERPLTPAAPPQERRAPPRRNGDAAAATRGGAHHRDERGLNGHGRRDEDHAPRPAGGGMPPRLAPATQKRVLGDIHMLREVAARDLRRDPRRMEAVDMALARLETLISPRDGVVDAQKAQALLTAVRDWLGPASDATTIVASIARTVLR